MTRKICAAFRWVWPAARRTRRHWPSHSPLGPYCDPPRRTAGWSILLRQREQPSEVPGCVPLRAAHHQDELACFVDLAGDRQGGGVLSVTGEQGNGHAPGELRRAAYAGWPWL